MIHLRTRNAHSAITELCRTISNADIITHKNKDGEYPRIREAVGVTIHNPRERMVFDKTQNPIEWFDSLRNLLPEFSMLIDPAMLYAPERMTASIVKLEWLNVEVYVRCDRGHLDMMIHIGLLNIEDWGERFFILTMLQEYAALAVELPMGICDITVAQVSLPADMEFVNRFANAPAEENPYQVSACVPGEMTLEHNMLAEAAMYPAMGIRNHWVRRTLSPMWQAFEALHGEERDEKAAMQKSQNCESLDVARATRMYLEGLRNE